METAWRRASSKVFGFLILPIAAAALVSIVVACSYTGTGVSIEHKQVGQIVAVVAGQITWYLLDRRFRKYLSIPPVLTSRESRAESRLVFWFRVISIGLLLEISPFRSAD